MQVALAAMLALTLIMLKMLSGSSGPLSLPVVDASQRGRRRLLCRAEDESTSIFVIPVGNINQCSQRIGDFASNYPRMGRFCHNHKVISVLTEEDGDPRKYWRASIEAATVTAKQKTRQTSSSAPLHSFLRESGRGIWLSTRIDAVRRSQLHRLQQQLYRHRPWRTHDHTEQAVKWPVDISQGLQVQATSKCCAFSRWSEKRCKQLRRTVSTYRPLVFVSLQPIRLAAPRCGTHFVTHRITRSASHLSRLKVETVRRAEAAFSAVHAYAEPVFQRLTRGLDSPSKDGDQCELQHKGSRLVHLTDKTVQSVIDVVARDDWEHVATTSGVVVHRQYITLGSDGMPAPPSSWETVAAATPAVARKESGVTGDGMSDRAPQGFACVKATAILNAPPEVVFMLFADNSRVSEYNEHCKRVIDVEILAPDTKITWAASGRMGPFKARDFCTLVHFRTLSDGTLAHVSRPVEHPAAPRSDQYVRSEILVAGNFMRAVPGDPSRTEFLMVTHVNLGGAAETRAGAMLVNSLCVRSPVDFIRRLDIAAQNLARQIQEAALAVSDDVGDSGISPFVLSPPLSSP